MSAVNWQPVLPYELVDATEHHGPYICTAYGSTVCDFYAMSDTSSLSVRNGGTSRPIPFTDAAEHAAFMARAANAHGDLMAILNRLANIANWGHDSDASAVDEYNSVAVDAMALLDKHGGQS